MIVSAVLFAQLTVTSAPADKYFGKLNMSPLRIRYEIMQLRKRYETHQLLPEQAVHLLLLTENAFDQWAKAYPKDPWLASTGFAMGNLYAELPGTVARAHAVALFVYVQTQFPSTSYASSSRTALHRGVATKPDPAWAKEMRAAATPAPTPSPLPAASPAPSVSPAPSASPPTGGGDALR
jgi:hypothetical protein